MSDYITLLGAEGVKQAGHNMSAAAETIRQAAAEIDFALTRHQQFLDDWLARFKAALSRSQEPSQ